MKQNFIITGINRVILVGKNEYPQNRIIFKQPTLSNELIYHFDGKAKVYFNGKVLETEENTIRFLPKGEVKEYIVEKQTLGECIDIFFDTDIPISNEAFIIKITQSTTIANLFKKLFAVWISKNDGYYFECISLLYKIFAEMQKKNYIPQNQYDLIKPAIEYVEENFLANKISVPFLAIAKHLLWFYYTIRGVSVFIFCELNGVHFNVWVDIFTLYTLDRFFLHLQKARFHL